MPPNGLDVAEVLQNEEGREGGSSTSSAFSPPPTHGELVKRRKELIKQTWALVEREVGVESTTVFYKRLWALHPEVRPVFRNTDIGVQSRKLYEMLRVAVRYIDQIDEMLPTLRGMGVRHARAYGVKREHYSAVTEVFVDVLNELLEDALLKERERLGITRASMAVLRLDIAAAWSWLLTVIGDSMANAADEDVAPPPAGGRSMRTHNEVVGADCGSVVTAATTRTDDEQFRSANR